MSVYNFKLYQYTDNKQQLRLYDYPIHVNDWISEHLNERKIEAKEVILSQKNILSDEDRKRISEINSRNRTIQNIYYIARSNIWDYFLTFTFNEQKVNRYNYDDCMKHAALYFKMLKKRFPDMVYLIVPELHKARKDKESGKLEINRAYHIHGLISGVPKELFIDSGKKDRGHVVYNFVAYDYGFTTATKVRNTTDVSGYLSKYITKDLMDNTKGKKRYISSLNVNRANTYTRNLLEHDFIDTLDSIADYVDYIKRVQIGDHTILYVELHDCEHLKEFVDSKIVDCPFDEHDEYI